MNKKELTRAMHTRGNRLVILVLPVMFVVAGVYMWKGAYNDTWRVIGGVALLAILLLFGARFLCVERLFDKVVFTERTIERRSLFGRKLVYLYSEVYGFIGTYGGGIAGKKCCIFTPKTLGGTVYAEINTSKYGNLPKANRAGVLYCLADDELMAFLHSCGIEWVREG